MRVIIGGSRSITDPSALEAAIKQAEFPITTIITGDSKGVDALAAAWAKNQDLGITVMPVEWSKYGGRAEQIRNEQVAEIADACILIWDGFSQGTYHLREIVQRRGLKLCVYQCNPQRATDRKTTTVFRTGT
jgi:hypothetical protein